MTDQQHPTELSPNTEVMLSSDLFDDGLCLENMSALAFAVLDAYMSGYGWLDSPTKKDCRGVAAALEAAADQVVPYLEEPNWGACNEMRCDIELYTDHMRKRSELLAIAAELRGTTPTETQ